MNKFYETIIKNLNKVEQNIKTLKSNPSKKESFRLITESLEIINANIAGIVREMEIKED